MRHFAEYLAIQEPVLKGLFGPCGSQLKAVATASPSITPFLEGGIVKFI